MQTKYNSIDYIFIFRYVSGTVVLDTQRPLSIDQPLLPMLANDSIDLVTAAMVFHHVKHVQTGDKPTAITIPLYHTHCTTYSWLSLYNYSFFMIYHHMSNMCQQR